MRFSGRATRLAAGKLLSVGRISVPLLLLLNGSEAIYATSEPGRPPEYCTVFHHMLKSAGSTVKSLLQRAAVQANLPKPAVCVTGAARVPTCLDAINSSAVIAGCAELLREPLQEAARECEYFTIMRHPIDRLVSAFFYCPTDHDVQNRPAKWCGYTDHEVPVTERLVEYAEQSWRNKAFRQMTFGLYCPADTFCEPRLDAPQTMEDPGGAEAFQRVEEIMSSYVAVGIMEHWDVSMQLFNARVRSPVPDWNQFRLANSGQSSGLRDEVEQWAHLSADIQRAIGTDLKLYAYALSVFKQQTTEVLGTNWAQ